MGYGYSDCAISWSVTLIKGQPGSSYYNWSFVVVCLFRIYSVDYGHTDPILGREVGGGCGITVGLLVSMETALYPQKSWYSLKPQPLGRFCWIFACAVYCGIGICLPKTSQIYQAVPEIAHSNQLDNQTQTKCIKSIFNTSALPMGRPSWLSCSESDRKAKYKMGRMDCDWQTWWVVGIHHT